jgi:ABC-2 type transport system permease protein
VHSVWLIAKREYVERIRSRAFRISTAVIPLAFAGIFGIAALSTKLASGPKNIAVASNDPVLAESTAAGLTAQRDRSSEDSGNRDAARGKKSLRVDVRTVASESDLSALNSEVESRQIDGYLWLKVKPGAAQPETMYVTRDSADIVGGGRMRDAVGYALVREELMKRGATKDGAEALLKDVNLRTMRVKDGQLVPSDNGKRFWGAYAITFLLYFTVVFYGVNVAQSVAAEKTSRVFEVLLVSAEPQALMGGKLLGVAAAGLTQMGIWIAVAVYFSFTAIAATVLQGGLAAYGVTALQLVFFVIYFLLGFFFYSALSAALGAAVNQESDVQQFNMLIVLPQVVGLVLIVYVLSNPGAWPVVLLSLFPPCMHIVMMLRMSAMAVPWWQLALSVVVMLASIYGVLWVASRIYRVGILMYGKPVTLPEMMRWIRYK